MSSQTAAELVREQEDVAAAIIATAHTLDVQELKAPNGSPIFASPAGRRYEVREDLLERPVRKRGCITVAEAASFSRYVSRHKKDATIIVGSESEGRLTATIDHHVPGADSPAGWGDHQCVLDLGADDEWKAWTENEGKRLSQTEFADFIEEMEHTIIEPDAASLREMVLKLKATSKQEFESDINLTTGEVALVYRDQQDTKGRMRMPEVVTFLAAPYRYAQPVEVEARLRYRVNQGTVQFFYKLIQADLKRRQSFMSVVEEVARDTEIQPLIAR